MKRLLCIYFCFLNYSLHILGQPYQIGKTTITFSDPSRNNRSIPTDIYYPSLQAGNNVTVAGATGIVFPVISFGHGFVINVDAYANIWNKLVPEGYIVALPKTEGSFSPSHGEFGKDLAFVILAMKDQNQITTSLFFNRVSSMNCVMGHSMGGGAAHLAAAGNQAIKSIASLAAAETNPSAITAAANLQIPSLIFAGANDCVTPPNSNQSPMYIAYKSNCKTYLSIIGGSHCLMAESNLNCSFGESTCSPAPTISRAQQHAVINSYLLPWLNYQLKNDCQSGRNFETLMRQDTKISFQSNCSFCIINNTPQQKANHQLNIYPNPFDKTIFIQNKSADITPIHISLQTLEGKTIMRKTLSGNNSEINTHQVPKGTYLLLVEKGEKRSMQKMIKAE